MQWLPIFVVLSGVVMLNWVQMNFNDIDVFLLSFSVNREILYMKSGERNMCRVITLVPAEEL